MATTTIYLSSTYEDLQDYRRAVFELLRKSDYHVIAMEDYVATDQRPIDKCLKDVEQADIYVGALWLSLWVRPASPPPESQRLVDHRVGVPTGANAQQTLPHVCSERDHSVASRV
jgi:hypothetical protein